MPSSFVQRTTLLSVLLFTGSMITAAQSGGRLIGTVTAKHSKPVAGVSVVATNQTTSDSESSQTKSDGGYAMKLRAGAYRITVEAPYEAQFVRGKAEYGGFANVICDDARKHCSTVENVMV